MPFATGVRAFQTLIAYLLPPPAWRVPVLLALGVLLGLLALVAHLANMTSYLSDDPKTCINCHIMNPQYATWQRGSHGRVTVCNDCHVPHDNLLAKYYFKGKDGSRHAFMYTFRLEPQVIRMHEDGAAVVQQNCIRCHASLFTGITKTEAPHAPSLRLHDTERRCWSCHRETPHGRVSSLSATPFVKTPALNATVPAWVDAFLQRQAAGQDRPSAGPQSFLQYQETHRQGDAAHDAP